MKGKLILLVVLALIITGCAASTLSRTAKDGATTLTLKNYVFTETIFCADGKTICSVNTMVPADTIMQGVLDKVITALKSLVGVVNVPVDAVKTVVPVVTK